LSTHHFIESFLADLEQSGKLVKAAVGGVMKVAVSKTKPAAWIPSPDGVVKVNVDAAVARNKDHGVAAAVARSAAGQYLGSSAVLITGISDPEVLEAIAVREGQNLALDIAAQKIKVASDCLSVVKAWREKNLGRYSHILHEISSSSVAFSEFSLVHESRVSNNEPHVLARSVLGSPVGRYMWLGVPPEGVLYPSFPE
jgi:ribonuclease HI